MPTFVIRESACIQKDLERNWSSFCGGGADGPICGNDEDDAIAQWCGFTGLPAEEAPEMRYHDGLGGWCEVHYEGLGAWFLEAETLGEAIAEAEGQSGLASTMEAGDGHFDAADVVAWHKVGESCFGTLWVIEINL